MNLVERAKNILASPRTEWDVIAAEATPSAQLVTGYVLPLAAIAALAGFIGMALIGATVPMMGTMRVGVAWGLASAIYNVIMAVVMCYVLAFIIDALAPTFGGTKSMAQALKVAVYAYTPVWVASIVTILPMLGFVVLFAALYAIYLLYLGLPRVMRAPQDKAAGYTAVVVIAAIVLGVVIGLIGAAIMQFGMPGTALGGMGRAGAPVHFDKDSPMGKLDDFSKKMEEANKRMEAAQKSGDPARQMEAAMGTLGTAMSGGKGVEPVQLDVLKPLVPDKAGGMARTDLRADRSGAAGLMVAKAEATYGDAAGGRTIDLEVTDTGGAAGLMALAGWMGIQGEHEDGDRREVTRKEGNRVVHEEVDKHGGPNKYTVILADRFMVSAEGHGVDIGTLKSTVNSVDLGKLESIK